MRKLLFQITLLILPFLVLGHGGSVDQSENIIENGIWYKLDQSNELSLEEVRNDQDWLENPSGSLLNFANANHAIWIKMHVSIRENDKVLSLENPLIDSISIYKVANNNAFSEFHTGAAFNFDDRKEKTVNFSEVLPTGSYDIIIRLKSNFPLQVPVKIMDAKEFHHQNHHSDTLVGVYIGIMVVMMIYNLFIFFSVRDRSYLYYIGYIIFATLLYTTFTGKTFEYLWPDLPYMNTLVPTFSCITTIFIAVFTIHFLKTKTSLPKLTFGLYIFIGIFAVCAIINLSGNYFLSAIISQPVSILFSFYLIIVGISSMRKGVKYAKYYLLGWSLFLISVIIYITQLNGVIPHTTLTKNITLLGSALEATLLSFALGYRITVYKNQKDKAQRKALAELKEKEKIIEERNVFLDRKVEERTKELNELNAQLAKTNDEKTAMLKEIHHRVKNNLQIVNSLLRLQSHEVQDQRIVTLFEESQNRVVSMAMLHEKLYQSNNLKEINVKDHFTLLAEDLLRSYNLNTEIDLKINIEEVDLGIKTLVPLGLIINEIITNSLKHAFKGRERGEIVLELSQIENGKFQLLVGDDGIGMNHNLVDPEYQSFGKELIEIFGEQINASIEQLKGTGTFYRLVFTRA